MTGGQRLSSTMVDPRPEPVQKVAAERKQSDYCPAEYFDPFDEVH